MLAPALILLAQSAPPPISGDWQANLFAVMLAVLIVLNIWDKVKRKPAIDEVLERKFKEAAEQTDKKIEALDRRRELGDKENVSLIHSEISNMKEFISEKINDNRANNTERFGELKGQMASFQTSLQGLSNDLMHQVGRLEGEMTARTRGHE